MAQTPPYIHRVYPLSGWRSHLGNAVLVIGDDKSWRINRATLKHIINFYLANSQLYPRKRDRRMTNDYLTHNPEDAQ